MGLGTDEFWDLTPRQFSALLERRRLRDDFWSCLAAQAPYMIASALTSKGARPQFEDFVLTRMRPQPEPDHHAMFLSLLKHNNGEKR